MAKKQSPKMKQAIRLWQNIQGEKQDRIQRRRGVLGNGNGVVRVPGRPDLCYMRINADSTKVWKVTNDRVSDTNGLAVIAEKHPDSQFWEIIDVDKQMLAQSGIGFSGDAYQRTHAQSHEWPDYSPGIDTLNVYRRAHVELRTEPNFDSYSLNVYVRPTVYTYQGQIRSFGGQTLSLSSYIPDTGIRNVLTYLDVTSNIAYANPGIVTTYSIESTQTPPLVNWYAKKSALVTLRQNQNLIQESDIEDVREERLGLIHNLQAEREPTVNDDATYGYSEGSIWIYGTAIYFCTNPVIGSAVWTQPAGGSNVWPKADKVNIDDTEYDTLAEAITAASSGDVIRLGVGDYEIADTIALGTKSLRFIGSGQSEESYIYTTSENASFSTQTLQIFENISIVGITLEDSSGRISAYNSTFYDIISNRTGTGSTGCIFYNCVLSAEIESYAINETDGGLNYYLYNCYIDSDLEGTASANFYLSNSKVTSTLSSTATNIGFYYDVNYKNYQDAIQFNLAPTQSDGEGSLMWDSDNGTLSLGMPGGNVRLQVGQELVFRGKCDDVGDISNGATVYVSDATGGVPLVKAITGTSDFDVAHRVFGVATEDITYNQMGYITFFGLVRDVNTSGLTEGEPVYIDTDGSYTNTPPVAPNAQIFVGITLREHATEGVIGVNPHTVHRIEDLSGVSIASLADKDALTWNETSGYWENTQEPAWEHVNMMSGRLWGGFITDNGDGTVTVSAGQGLIKEDEAGPEDVPTSLLEGQGSKLSLVSWAENTSVSCADNAYNYLYYDGSSGTLASTTDFYSISFTRDFTVGRVYRGGTTVTIRLCGTNLWNFDRRVQLFGEEVFPVVKAFGVIPSETGTRNVAVTAGVLWAELVNRFSIDAVDTSGTDTFTYWYRDGAGGWTDVASQTQIDNAYWDDNSGTLDTLTTNRYGVHWLYMVHTGDLHVVYGQGDYTETLAELATPPATLPGLLEAYSTIIGKIVIQEGEATFHSIETPDTATFSSSGVSNHNELAGLQGGTASEYYHLTAAEYTAKGDVVGPVSATDNAIARYHENTGKIIKDSAVTIDDSGNIVVSGTVDGRDISADGSKLDGIASGAVADHGALTGLGDDDHPQYMRNDADETTTGYIVTHRAVASHTDGSVRRIINPGGGGYYGSGISTGAIAIKLPAATEGYSCMVKFRVSVYDHTDGESFDVYVAGYTSPSQPQWDRTTAYIVGFPQTDRNFTVRFGRSATNWIVWIGETTSTWSYIGVHVTDVQLGADYYYSADYFDDWEVGLATSFDTVYKTITDTQIT